MDLLHRALDRLEDGFAVLAACLLVFTVIFVPVDVASRYFFNSPITWVYEVTEYILLFVPCLGMAWLARKDGHVAIDILTSRVVGRTKIMLDAAAALLVALICGFIAWWASVVTVDSYKAKAIIENVLQTPQWLIYVAIPAGFGLCAIEFTRKAFRSWSAIESAPQSKAVT